MSKVTIGFIPRERFSLAPECLQRILEFTPLPYNLIVVDCNTPRLYWNQMEPLLRGRSNVKVIHHDEYLLPNQCRNLVIEEARDEFLCLIENDDLVEEGWLNRFLISMEKHRSDVVIPLVMEGRPGEAKVHFDEALGSVKKVAIDDEIKLEILARPGKKENDPGAASRVEQFMETHCLFFRRDVFNRTGPFDGELNTSEEIDLSLALYNAGASAVFDPACVVHYVQPPKPVLSEDAGYFSLKWDIERARRSHDRIQQRWNLIHMPQLLGFVEERNLRGLGSLRRWRQELERIATGGSPFILVDMDQWHGSEIVEGLRYFPFLERDGQYWGAPANDNQAIQELERLRQSGAAAVAFTWQAFWWFDYYKEFYRHLCSSFRKILANDHVVAFDLKGPSA